MSKTDAAPEAAEKTVEETITDTSTELQAPAGSLCATCVLFDGGRCQHFRNVIEATGEAVPFVSGCPDHTPESE